MIGGRALAAPGAVLLLALAGCFGAQRPTADQAVVIPATPVPAAPSAVLPPFGAPSGVPDQVPDAVPRVEPLSRYGNPPFYDVFGKRYFVLSSSVGYVERGVASWYGPGFHKIRTSAGEPYDMYGMTAAHKTLPLPAYVRVTNLQNGRSVVVRVNDRGPFVGNRIIDLSYTAAAKLDMLRDGTAMVEVRSIDPAASQAPPPVTAAVFENVAQEETPVVPVPAGAPAMSTSGGTGPATPGAAATATPGANHAASAGAPALFIQAGAFSDPKNAARLAAKLRDGGYGNVFVRGNQISGRSLYRVRIGPVPDVPEFDRIVTALERIGINDAHLALD